MASTSKMVKGNELDLERTLFLRVSNGVGLIMLSPLVYMVSTALKPTSELFLFPPQIFVYESDAKKFLQDCCFKRSGTTMVPLHSIYFQQLCRIGEHRRWRHCHFRTCGISAKQARYAVQKGDIQCRHPCADVSPQVTQIPQFLAVTGLE